MIDYSGAGLKVERAKAHIAEAERISAAFLRAHPYRVTKEIDLEIERYAILVSLLKPIPRIMSVVMGDAIHNLRTALDHAICATVANEGKTIRDTTFPFAKNEFDFDEVLKRKARKAPANAKAVCRDVQPYPGGNDSLVALHELDLMDKHQLVLALAAAGEFRQLYIERGGQPEQMVSDRIYYLGAETQVILSPKGREWDTPFEIGISVEIVFGPNTPLAGEPCVRSLTKLAVAVERVLNLFHTICP